MRRAVICGPVAVVLLIANCGSVDGEGASDGGSAETPAPEPAQELTYVSLGDSWPEGAHCNGCRTFPQTHAEALGEALERPITLKELAGQAQPYFEPIGGAASLLQALETDEAFRDEVATGDIIVIATGPNEIEPTVEAIKSGTCGGQDDKACVDELARTWERDFDAILDEIETLREGRPTAIRLVNAANFLNNDPAFNAAQGRGVATIFEALTQVLCANAEAHGAVCIDVRPVLNGPDFEQPVNDSSQQAMDAVADLLIQAGAPELE